MKTLVENINETASQIETQLRELLLSHSEIYKWNVNSPYDSVVVIDAYGSYAYRELSEEGRQLQSWLLENYRRFYVLLQTLLREQSRDILKKLSDANKVIERTLEQGHTWSTTTEEALYRA